MVTTADKTNNIPLCTNAGSGRFVDLFLLKEGDSAS